MTRLKNIILFFIGLINIYQFTPIKSLSDIKTNSIITIFCLENVKSEMLKANIKYDKKVGIQTCECYLDNLSENISHEKSIEKCKLETIKNYNL